VREQREPAFYRERPASRDELGDRSCSSPRPVRRG